MLINCRCGCSDIVKEKTEILSETDLPGGFRIWCNQCNYSTEFHIEYADAEREWNLKIERYMQENIYTCPTENLKSLENRHEGKRCFIVGSGPSLKKMDLRKLKGWLLFGGNQIYKHYRNFLPPMTYWFVGDHTCIPKINADRVDGYDTENVGQRFYRAGGFWVRVAYYPNANPYYVEDVQPVKEFKCDLTKPITHGNSITSESLAFAIYMGCNPIYIIGVDMAYKPDEKGFTSFSYDKAHQAHEKIREYCDNHKIEIFNAGIGGELKAYKRIKYEGLFA